MTDNEKLARWQGKIDSNKINLFVKTPTGFWPDYLNDDAAAMSLLDTLVEKGYDPALYYYRGHNTWYLQTFDGELAVNYLQRATRNEAIVAAVLELIEKEASHE